MGKIITSVFAAAIGICIIVNYAVSGSLTWAWFPIFSIGYVWLLLLPFMLIKRNRLPLTLLTFTVITLPFLFLLNIIIPGRNWFYALGVPVAIVSIAATWVTYVVFKFSRMNIWHKAAAALFLFGVAVSGIAQFFVAEFLNESLSQFLNLSEIITLTSALALTALLVIIGKGKKPEEEFIVLNKN